MLETKEDLLIQAIHKWGNDAQMDRMISDMNHLTAALEGLKATHYSSDRVDVVREEIASVQIMINQLRLIFGRSDVDAYVEEKLIVLEYRINNETIE